MFSNPTDRWPDVFGHIPFFHEYPYFLPCLIAGFIAFLSFAISLIALKEVRRSNALRGSSRILILLKTLPSSRKITLKNAWRRVVQKINPKKSKQQVEGSTAPLLSHPQPIDYGTSEAERALPLPVEHSQEKPSLSLLFTPSFFTILFNFGLLSFTEMGASALLPLMLSTPIEYGGLAMDPLQIGVMMGAYGIANGVISAAFFGRVLRRFGPRRVFQIGVMSFFVVFAGFPIANILARRAGKVDGWALAIVAMQFGAMTIMSPCYGAPFRTNWKLSLTHTDDSCYGSHSCKPSS